jgi:hypothetical protein
LNLFFQATAEQSGVSGVFCPQPALPKNANAFLGSAG